MRSTSFLLSLTMCLLLVTVVSVQAEPTVIRFSHVVGDDTPKGQMALRLKQILEERTPDRFSVEVYPNATMFNDDQVLEALLLDDVQMAAPSLSKFSIYTKQLQLFDLPFLFADTAAVDRFQTSEEGQALLTSFQDRGVVGLGYLHNGLKQLSANKRLVLPGDAAGLKFRIQQSEVLSAQFAALGAEGIARPFSQVFSLLSAGVLDGQENTWSNIASKKLYTVQAAITESNHGVIDYMVVTSANFWDSLRDYDKQQLQVAVAEAVEYGNSLAAEIDQKDKQTVIDAKQAEVITLSAADRVKWVEAMRPVWKKFESAIGADLIEKAHEKNQ